MHDRTFVLMSYRYTCCRRYLDINLLQNLITYLEKLHAKNLATKDHTVLLLSCVSKLKESEKVAKLDAIFEGAMDNKQENTTRDARGNLPEGRVVFDVEAAVSTLYECNNTEHALKLAQTHGQHETYIKMQVRLGSGLTIGLL